MRTPPPHPGAPTMQRGPSSKSRSQTCSLTPSSNATMRCWRRWKRGWRTSSRVSTLGWNAPTIAPWPTAEPGLRSTGCSPKRTSSGCATGSPPTAEWLRYWISGGRYSTRRQSFVGCSPTTRCCSAGCPSSPTSSARPFSGSRTAGRAVRSLSSTRSPRLCSAGCAARCDGALRHRCQGAGVGCHAARGCQRHRCRASRLERTLRRAHPLHLGARTAARGVADQPSSMPQVRLHVSPGARRRMPRPLFNASAGAVMGSMATASACPG